MNILAIEPYYDGSHKAFIDGWLELSRHKLSLLTMPAHKWKWRMRGAAIEMAKQVDWLHTCGHRFDAVFCSDMLNLAEFAGLVNPAVAALPRIVYFHENQITYPCRIEDERDYQFAVTNITTAACAAQVWFNSAYHRDDFLIGARRILAKMPDFNCLDILDRIKAKSFIVHPCIDPVTPILPAAEGTLKIIWSARWEHDKNPEDFFAALRLLRKMRTDFRITVTGQSFRDAPPVFNAARDEFADIIDNWGFLPSKAAYYDALKAADVFVSTATHEFFGISAVEAAAAGCCVLLPKRLAYPEVFADMDEVFYDGNCKDLAAKLADLARNRIKLVNLAKKCCEIGKKYFWHNNISIMDALVDNIKQ